MTDKDRFDICSDADPDVLRSLSEGTSEVTQFFRKNYFTSFIPEGGSAIKFLTGKKGSGKTHLLSLLELEARDAGMETVMLSAEDFLLSDLSNLYREVIGRIDADALASDVAHVVMKKLGYGDFELGGNKSVFDQLADRGEADPLTVRSINKGIKDFIMNNPKMDSNFAICFSLLISGKVGTTAIDDAERELIMNWLQGDAELKIRELRTIGLLPYKLTKFNARNMLRSLSQLILLSGKSGLAIMVDDLEVFLSGSTLNPVRYTKKRRDDSFESIRELVDDVDTMKGLFFIFAFDSVMLDDDRKGFKSYQALWLRIQNEIISERLNLFRTLLDMDDINSYYLTKESIVTMSGKYSAYLRSKGIESEPVTGEIAEKLMLTGRNGAVSLPLLLLEEMLGNDGKEEDYE